MNVCPEIEMIPVTHGKELFAREVRRVCSERKFDCVAVDIPEAFQDELGEAVDNLPLVSVILARFHDSVIGGIMAEVRSNTAVADYDGSNDDDGDDDYDDKWFYVPIDPCDAMIEGVRQARQRRAPFYCVGAPILGEPYPLPPMPDEYAIEKIGFDAYAAVCRAAVGRVLVDTEEYDEARHIAGRLRELRARYKNILAITHLRHFDTVLGMIGESENHGRGNDGNHNNSDYGNGQNHDDTRDANPYTSVITRYVNPDHLYFALGELPFVAAKTQMERQNPFAEPVDLTDAIKDLFRETRDNYFDDREQAVHLSPVRIQSALTYLRNLTVMSGRLIPSLFDIVEAAKGVGGNAYALRILKSAKYYPYLPFESGEALVNVGIDRISLLEDSAPGSVRETYYAVNLFRDANMEWRALDIKPDPSTLQKKNYRYKWGAGSVCSHLPEDTRLEGFNAHARKKALRVVTEHLARTEKFTTSVKDGIDIRETLRNWHTGGIYVKELPPARGKVDTVVVIFDESDDDRYPQRATWYAEHEGESTLSFYATDVFGDLIGPGIGRCVYGGVALLFPPRDVPDLFDVTGLMGISGCAARLVAGSLMFSGEKNVAYIAARPPSQRIRALSANFKKHLVWIPMSTFSTETLSRLRRFHVLNGRDVRSWAARFIGDEP